MPCDLPGSEIFRRSRLRGVDARLHSRRHNYRLFARGRGRLLAGGANAKKFQHIADLRIAFLAESFLDVIRQGEVDRIRAPAFLANDMVATAVSGGQFIKAGAVVEVAAPHQTEALKGGETAIDGHQIAGLDAQDRK